jgi:dTDP-4-dehydrorhamnose reductase
MRVAVLGARGQLGAAVVHELSARHEVAALDRAALDLTDAGAVERMLSRLDPEAVVNCAGYNAVDAAEDHPVAALEANAFAVRTLARLATARRARLVHYSSDFVFDGKTDRPYTEEDRPNPQSVYAASKVLGEWFAADAPGAYVIRVESLFGQAPGARPPKGSVAVILRALAHGEEAVVFVDRTVSPTFVMDAARATRQLVEAQAPSGLYHAVNSGCCTWMEFAQEAARLLGVTPRLRPVRMADVPLRAARPRYCALSNAKLASAGIAMPTWQDALGRHLRVNVEM